MGERSKHLFGFKACQIAMAAIAEAEYHEKRASWWQREYEAAVETVKKTAKLEIKMQAVTGGERATLDINYGDPSAYRRMQESWDKIHAHRTAAEKFRMDAKVYGTQGERTYELDTGDVHHYRLGGGPRDE